jgi:hypothetical protein
VADGAFLRNRGGNANVATAGALTGAVQADAYRSHSHGGSTAAVALVTDPEAGHTHGWGGVWSNDNSTVGSYPYGDGASNTYSDGLGYWSMGTVWGVNTTTNGAHWHYLWSRNDDFNCTGDAAGRFGLPRCPDNGGGDFWGPSNTYQAFADTAGDHAHSLPNHRHWIQPRTSGVGTAHAHTIGAHAHALSITATGDVETRPLNVAVIFWRRTN